jgi:hypothetical protein
MVKSTRKTTAIMLVAAVVTMSAVTHAVAGGDIDQGTVGGISYRSDSEIMLSGTPATVDVSCPTGTFPTGGGFEVIATPAYSAYQALPVNLDTATRGPDAWRTVAIEENPPGNASEPVSRVICRAGAPRFVKASGQLPEGTPGAVTLTARCPSGTHVSGGGAAAGINGTPGDAYVNSTYPIDSRDADAQPDDGWRARLYGVRQPGTRVVAICVEEAPTYDKRTFEVEPGSNTGAFLECSPSEQALGVGVRLDGNAAEGRAFSASTADAFPGAPNDDGNAVPDDNALGSAINDSGDPKNVSVFSICG